MRRASRLLYTSMFAFVGRWSWVFDDLVETDRLETSGPMLNSLYVPVEQ